MAKRLLIVDDNTVERDGMAAVLRRQGFEVMTAPGGTEAIVVAAVKRPDLILLDMIMRGSDGWRFLDERQKQTSLKKVPVIIVTGLAVASEQWAKALGADALLKKPVDVDEMVKIIRESVA